MHLYYIFYNGRIPTACGIVGLNHYSTERYIPNRMFFPLKKQRNTVPTGLTAIYGNLLSTVTLPAGWEWESPNVTVGNTGQQTHKATFTPDDTNNYNIVTGIYVLITVSSLPITITVTAGQNKVYGENDPVYTYTFAPALVGTDSFSGTLSRATGENVGTYAINYKD